MPLLNIYSMNCGIAYFCRFFRTLLDLKSKLNVHICSHDGLYTYSAPGASSVTVSIIPVNRCHSIAPRLKWAPTSQRQRNFRPVTSKTTGANVYRFARTAAWHPYFNVDLNLLTYFKYRKDVNYVEA
jgi:hypothetical protein